MIWILAAILAQDDVCLVELRKFEVKPKAATTTAAGVLANRSPIELTNVSVEVSLHGEDGALVKAFPPVILERLTARGSADLKAETAGTPAFRSHRVKVSYRTGGFDCSFEFENGKLKSGKLYEDAPAAGLRLGFAGIFTVPGDWKKLGPNQKSEYTGDTIFVGLLAEGLDEKARPEGAFDITLYFAGKKQGNIRRLVDKGHWKLDANGIPARDADPVIIGYDAEKKALMIGLCKLEEKDQLEKVTFDAKFTWKKQTWKWTGIKPPFKEAAKPPEKTEKK